MQFTLMNNAEIIAVYTETSLLYYRGYRHWTTEKANNYKWCHEGKQTKKSVWTMGFILFIMPGFSAEIFMPDIQYR